MCVCVCGERGERERETERQTERETDRKRDRQKERETELEGGFRERERAETQSEHERLR